MNRLWLQRALGTLWIVDGLLQLRPRMIGAGFVDQNVLPLMHGEPPWLKQLLGFDAHLLLWHAACADIVVGLLQLLMGVALMNDAWSQWATLASASWAFAVWVLGEGFGQLLTGQTGLTRGAPGAALLYAALSLGLWPRWPAARRLRYFSRIAAGLWTLEGFLWLEPGVRSQIGNALAMPRGGMFVAFGASLILAGLFLGGSFSRRIAAFVSGIAAMVLWVGIQRLGLFWRPYATDPNSGIVIALLALAVWPGKRPGKDALPDESGSHPNRAG